MTLDSVRYLMPNLAPINHANGQTLSREHASRLNITVSSIGIV